MTRKLAGAWLLAVLAGCSQTSPSGGTAANSTGPAVVGSSSSTDGDVGDGSDVKMAQVVLNVPEMH